MPICGKINITSIVMSLISFPVQSNTMTRFHGFPLLLFLIVWPICPGIHGERHQRVPPIYMNQFAVHVPSGADAADNVAAKYGFQNLGQVILHFMFILLL